MMRRLWRRMSSWFTETPTYRQALELFEDHGIERARSQIYRWSIDLGEHFLYIVPSDTEGELRTYSLHDNSACAHWRVATLDGHPGGWGQHAAGCCDTAERAARECLRAYYGYLGRPFVFEEAWDEMREELAMKALENL